jgi:hypothetical protein
VADEKKLPYDAVTGEELAPRETPGYYPGFSTMAQAAYWDEATRKTITERVEKIPPVRFFHAEEAALLEAMLARIVPQGDRMAERKIPILPWIDQRLHRNELNGYRYETMPPDQEAYRLGLAAVEAMANMRFSAPFVQLAVHQQELLLQSIHDGKPDPAHAHWDAMDVHRWWAMVMEDAVSVYYAHPWAWDEIGFGGPAYPRGYMRLENGLPEPWEVDEKRYAWNAPVDSITGDANAELPPEHGGSHGHGGTH